MMGVQTRQRKLKSRQTKLSRRITKLNCYRNKLLSMKSWFKEWNNEREEINRKIEQTATDLENRVKLKKVKEEINKRLAEEICQRQQLAQQVDRLSVCGINVLSTRTTIANNAWNPYLHETQGSEGQPT